MLLLMPILMGLTGASGGKTPAAQLRMNQIQVIGTHNSYHVASPGPLHDLLTKARPDALEWEYTHAPLDVQLDRGVRSLELDVHHDPAGTKVMHVPRYDPSSTCSTFVECLGTVRAWSDSHRNHVPILMLVELKDEKIPLVNVLPFEEAALDQLDAEIRSVFSPDRLLIPDNVRRDGLTLAESIQEKGWPLLKDARGKVMLVLHARGRHAELYTFGRPSLEGRAMFLESQEGKPFASVFIRNNPRDPDIGRLVKEGFIVRTRADANVVAVANGAIDNREAALAGGANIVSTDFPNGETEPKTGYVVKLPGDVPARCNPLNSPAGSDSLKKDEG